MRPVTVGRLQFAWAWNQISNGLWHTGLILLLYTVATPGQDFPFTIQFSYLEAEKKQYVILYLQKPRWSHWVSQFNFPISLARTDIVILRKQACQVGCAHFTLEIILHVSPDCCAQKYYCTKVFFYVETNFIFNNQVNLKIICNLKVLRLVSTLIQKCNQTD